MPETGSNNPKNGGKSPGDKERSDDSTEESEAAGGKGTVAAKKRLSRNKAGIGNDSGSDSSLKEPEEPFSSLSNNDQRIFVSTACEPKILETAWLVDKNNNPKTLGECKLQWQQLSVGLKELFNATQAMGAVVPCNAFESAKSLLDNKYSDIKDLTGIALSYVSAANVLDIEFMKDFPQLKDIITSCFEFTKNKRSVEDVLQFVDKLHTHLKPPDSTSIVETIEVMYPQCFNKAWRRAAVKIKEDPRLVLAQADIEKGLIVAALSACMVHFGPKQTPNVGRGSGPDKQNKKPLYYDILRGIPDAIKKVAKYKGHGQLIRGLAVVNQGFIQDENFSDPPAPVAPTDKFLTLYEKANYSLTGGQGRQTLYTALLSGLNILQMAVVSVAQNAAVLKEYISNEDALEKQLESKNLAEYKTPIQELLKFFLEEHFLMPPQVELKSCLRLLQNSCGSTFFSSAIVHGDILETLKKAAEASADEDAIVADSNDNGVVLPKSGDKKKKRKTATTNRNTKRRKSARKPKDDSSDDDDAEDPSVDDDEMEEQAIANRIRNELDASLVLKRAKVESFVKSEWIYLEHDVLGSKDVVHALESFELFMGKVYNKICKIKNEPDVAKKDEA